MDKGGWKEDFPFQPCVRREGVEREAPTSLYNLWRSGGRLLTGQGLKSEYSVRATCGYQKLQVSQRFCAEGSGSRKIRVQEVFAELPRVFTHASRGRVFSYSSYFMLKGHSMAIGFNPNRRAGSKAVWIVLLTVKSPVSWFVLVLGTSVLGLVMGPGVCSFYNFNMDCMVAGTGIGS